MKGRRQFRMTAWALTGWIIMLSTTDAHAYVDPGAGSYLLQLAAAALLGAAFTIKLYWTKIKLFLSRPFYRSNRRDDHD